MAAVLNVSGRAIHTQICSFNKDKRRMEIHKKFSFNPSSLVIVNDDDWKKLKKTKLIEECMDNEELCVGSRARKKSGMLEKEVEELDEEAKEKGKKDKKEKEEE